MSASLQKALATARAVLLAKQDWLFHVRKGNFPQQFLDIAVAYRHAAAERVWELQCMVDPTLR